MGFFNALRGDFTHDSLFKELYNMSLPAITATATLAADPEPKLSPDATSVANSRIACRARKTNRETGQWEDAGTTWLTCVARDGLAENIVTKFSKGQKIFVKGQLKQREYEKDGQKRTVFEVNVFEAAEP